MAEEEKKYIEDGKRIIDRYKGYLDKSEKPKLDIIKSLLNDYSGLLTKYEELVKNNGDFQPEIEEAGSEKRDDEQKRKLAELKSGILKIIQNRMTATLIFFFLFRKADFITEKYYNWLLPYVDAIDSKIPGFSRSWNSYRRNYDGMLGLVRAAMKVLELEEEKTKLGWVQAVMKKLKTGDNNE